MNREILFRGFERDRKNGEWVYGSTLLGCDYCGESVVYIYPHDTKIDGRGCIGNYEGVRVIPESVGQWTGYKDKNGKKIFEGDILERRGERAGINATVIRFENGCFTSNVFDLMTDGDPIGDIEYGIVSIIDKFEVIGNEYENPNLIELKRKEAGVR